MIVMVLIFCLTTIVLAYFGYVDCVEYIIHNVINNWYYICIMVLISKIIDYIFLRKY